MTQKRFFNKYNGLNYEKEFLKIINNNTNNTFKPSVDKFSHYDFYNEEINAYIELKTRNGTYNPFFVNFSKIAFSYIESLTANGEAKSIYCFWDYSKNDIYTWIFKQEDFHRLKENTKYAPNNQKVALIYTSECIRGWDNLYKIINDI